MQRMFMFLMWMLLPSLAWAGEGESLNGAEIGLIWGAPFAGILLSIAVFPLLASHFWEHHYGKIAAAWAVAFVLPMAAIYGPGFALHTVLHTLLLEYIPFIALIAALFTVAAGIRVRGPFGGTPLSNLGILAAGTAVASWTGTTGASMLFIRPLIRANLWRNNTTHIFVFFIFLVSNLGGALTPLGDPPLFMGFLKGIEFSWTLTNIWKEMLAVVIPLFVIFFALDTWAYKRETGQAEPSEEKYGLDGLVNLPLLLAVIGAVLLSAMWKPGTYIDVGGIHVEHQNIAREVILLIVAGVSLKLTPKAVHEANEFSWGPLKEVAKLFVVIFITIAPVIAILNAGEQGALASLVAMTRTESGELSNPMFFWMTGALSSFLDNAPTYLVFFELAGGDPKELMTTLSTTLAAVSCGAVFMGANSYIGNAPNFMVKAVVESRGVKMPSFFAYCGWALVFLVPLFGLVTVLFFT